MTCFYGKYRGNVAANADPLQLGRIQVTVPAVLGEGQMSWAMPCTPFAGSGVGWFALPPVGAKVWVEFEQGNPDYPIWSGCYWGSGEVPASPANADTKVFKTNGITLTFSDVQGSGGLTIEVGSPVLSSPLKIVLGSSGIELSNQSSNVKLTSSSVSVNNGALEVM
jgi:hypothetical protein